MTDVAAFRAEYRRAVEEILPFLRDDGLAAIGRHNPGWGPGRFDVAGYLRASETRYAIALETYRRHGGRQLDRVRALDVGGFMGTFPLALRRCGARVTLTERYGYYYGAFDPIRDRLLEAGVEVLDLDFTEPQAVTRLGHFDLVTSMALLEHLADSPRPLMENTRAVLAPGGRLVVEVPNLAYWPRRLDLLAGRTVHPPIRDLYASEPPFTGHHREYTEGDLRELLEIAGFTVHEVVTFDYTPQEPPPTGPAALVARARRRVRSAREVLLACASAQPG